jgi:hypothetical protein
VIEASTSKGPGFDRNFFNGAGLSSRKRPALRLGRAIKMPGMKIFGRAELTQSSATKSFHEQGETDVLHVCKEITLGVGRVQILYTDDAD